MYTITHCKNIKFILTLSSSGCGSWRLCDVCINIGTCIQLLSRKFIKLKEIQVNISISNMGNLEYPAYVEVDRRSRSYFLYK